MFEFLRFDLDTGKISTAPCKDDPETTNEKICMTPANSMNEKTCMSASTMNEKSMNEKTLHEKSTDKLVPTYKMKRYKFKKTFQPTTIHVSWIREKLSAENVLDHMGQYGPCMLEDWDFPGHTATIKYEDPQDAQRALSAKDEDVKMVPAVS